MLIVGNPEVERILRDNPDRVVAAVADAYRAHADGATVVPHSVFIREAADAAERIIALPAMMTEPDHRLAGIKWISSFPDNIHRGLTRASAAILLNSLDDGRATALLEGSAISAARTAAGAAVAAELLLRDAPAAARSGVTLVGCGVINRAVLKHLRLLLPELQQVTVYDADPQRARMFVDQVAAEHPDLDLELIEPGADSQASLAEVLGRHRLISFATTAGRPHTGIEAVPAGSVVLHLSLRDLSPAAVLSARNVTDDRDHVCRAATSLDLAAREFGGNTFIEAELGELLSGTCRWEHDPAAITIFSPFGLGVLDLAVASLVVAEATRAGLGTVLPDFHPPIIADGEKSASTTDEFTAEGTR